MNNHVIIIAEAGVNHNGNYDLAVKMIHEAKRAGADYVKFQTAVPELVISTFAPKAEYQKETTGSEESQLDMCRAIHLPLSDYKRLKAVCDEVGIGFMSTPFDLVSIDTLEPLDMDYYKIPSGEITNLPYLRKIASKHRPVIMSTGMSNIECAGAGWIAAQPNNASSLQHRVSHTILRRESGGNAHHRRAIRHCGGLQRPHPRHRGACGCRGIRSEND